MNKNKMKGAKLASLVTASVVTLSAIALAVLYIITSYLPLLLAGIILLLPSVIDLLFLLPKSEVKTSPDTLQTENNGDEKSNFFKKIITAFKKLPKTIEKLCRFFSRVYAEGREVAIISLSVLAVIVTNVWFWSYANKTAPHKLGFIVPVILVGMFVLFVVLDKWCKHTDDGTDAFYSVLIKNLVSVLTIGKILTVVIAAISTLCILGVYDAVRWTALAFSLVFLYITVFVCLSLAVHLIKKETDKNPEIFIPLPGKRNKDLGVLTYLEQNTGISMRSLWSIKLIKTIAPVAVLFSAAILWLSTGIVQVEAYQEGALYRLGKLSDEPLRPGIHLTLPWPLDKVELYDTESVNEITIGYLSADATDNLWTESHGNNEYKLLLGGGNELVSMNLRIEYKIGDLEQYLKNSGSPESLLESAAYETVTSRTISTDLDTLLAADRAEFSISFREELEKRIEKYNTGLSIVSVVIESIHPPVEVAQIYQQIISAGIEAEKIILDAQAVAGVTLADAQTQYDKDVNTATANSEENIAAAKSSVSEFMASVEADNAYGDDYRYYKYLDALKKAYADATLIIVGEGVDASSLYLGNITGIN